MKLYRIIGGTSGHGFPVGTVVAGVPGWLGTMVRADAAHLPLDLNWGVTAYVAPWHLEPIPDEDQ